jgi:hypothetical protein
MAKTTVDGDRKVESRSTFDSSGSTYRILTSIDEAHTLGIFALISWLKKPKTKKK